MVQRLDIFNNTKEDYALNFIEQHEPPEGWFGGFSGGKDSLVLKTIGDKANTKTPIQWFYSSTGIDPPELVKYIKKYHPDVIFKKPKRSFYEEMKKKATLLNLIVGVVII